MRVSKQQDDQSPKGKVVLKYFLESLVEVGEVFRPGRRDFVQEENLLVGKQVAASKPFSGLP